MSVETITLDRNILARMIEYLGGPTLEEATAVFLSRCDLYDHASFEVRPPTQVVYYLEQGLDVGRSLWDRRVFLVHLDLDYFNFDDPAAAYRDRQRIFRVQQPVVKIILSRLAEYGIVPLHLITGRGHHFVWQLDRRAPCFKKLVAFGVLPPREERLTEAPRSPAGEKIPNELVQAFAGLGMVMEFLAQQLRAAGAPLCELPVMITGIPAPPAPGRNREIVCLDISAFGDPIHTRVIRLPFSQYGKTWVNREIPTPAMDDTIPEIFTIPLGELGLAEAVERMQDQEWVAGYAGQVSTRIPDSTGGMKNLTAAYEDSRLHHFHAWFYARNPEPPGSRPAMYERLDLEELDPCTHQLLKDPNRKLLEAAVLQRVVRVLLALGWHPRQIGGLIRCQYERQRDLWGTHWCLFDPGIRAEFYARLFAGMIFTGSDDLQDLTCAAAKEKGVCLRQAERCDLERYRHLLQGRKSYAGI